MNVQCAAILAGGQSRRMGENKALLEVGGEPLIARVANVLRPLFPNIIVVTGDAATANASGLPAIPDAVSARGPLSGLHAALTHNQAPTFCVACDMPYLNADFIVWMRDYFPSCDVFAPRLDDHWEPLHAIYAPSCLPRFEAELARERPASLQKLLSELQTRAVPDGVAARFDPQLQMFANWNTLEDVNR